jgi:YVTN family beta-propeller protein
VTRRTVVAVAFVIVAAAAGVATAQIPARQDVELPTMQRITPAGRVTPVGTFPTGLALSPDGSRVAVTTSGAIATTLPPGTVYILDAATGAIVQVLPEFDTAWGVGWPSDDQLLVAGGDAKQVWTYSSIGGVLVKIATQSTPGFVGGLSASGRTVVALPRDDAVLIGADRVDGVPSPFALADTGAGIFASNWRGNTVTVIDPASHTTNSVTAGDHPEGMALTPDGSTLLVANANDATVSVLDIASRTVTQTIPLALFPDTPTDSPSAVAVAPDGRAYVAVSADNAVAVLDPVPDGYVLAGYIPTAWYPTAIAVGPEGTLHVVAARGTGDGPVATLTGVPSETNPVVDGAYGTSGVLETIGDPQAAIDTALVRRNNARALHTSIPSAIQHVIYVVRENKTYDEVLGDMPQGDGDPAYALFPAFVTPNAHAMAARWVLADRFYYPGEASKTGHFWTDAADVSDIEERQWHSQGLSASWGDEANYPSGGLLLDSARRHGVSFRAYNEELLEELHGRIGPYQAPEELYPRQDHAISEVVRYNGWAAEFDKFAAGDCSGTLEAYASHCDLPALEYVYFGNDHGAYGESGKPTPPSSVADNDYATGLLVEKVSHSKYWSTTAIVVVEDDPQSGGDHVSSYRGLVLVASPYAKSRYVTHTRYTLAGVLHFIEEVTGLPPLSQFDAMARPLDDMFTTEPDLTPYAALPEIVPFEVFLPGNEFEAEGRRLVHGVDDISDDRAATNLMWRMVRGYSLDEFLARRAER